MVSGTNFLFGSMRRMVNGLADTNPLAVRVSSTSEGVRIAWVTDVHQVWCELGVHNSRTDGSASKPEKSVRTNLEHIVSHSPFSSPKSSISYCTNALYRMSVLFSGANTTVRTTARILPTMQRPPAP